MPNIFPKAVKLSGAILPLKINIKKVLSPSQMVSDIALTNFESETRLNERRETLTQQPSLFDQPPEPEPAHHSSRPEINIPKIQAELQEDAGNLKVKVVRGNGDMRASIRETDKLLHIHINPKKIRTLAQLDKVMEQCQSSINWGR